MGGEPSTSLVRLSTRLVRGAGLIREEWPRVQGGASRTTLDSMLLRWLDLMQDYFHAGGTGCAMSLAGQQCKQSWDAAPLCWTCAGGQGLPPKTVRKEDSDDGAKRGPGVVGDTAGAVGGGAHPGPGSGGGDGRGRDYRYPATGPHSTRRGRAGRNRGYCPPPPPGASILLQCNRPGCRRTSVHVHMSALGACRRLWACDLFGMEPTVPKRPEWERAAALGTFGETLVVEHLKAQGHELWNTLDDQQALEFEENGIWYVGHPDGDIQHRTGDSILPGAHNLEMDAQLLFLAQWQTGLTSERHRIAIKGFLPCHAKSLPATLAEKRSPTHYRWQLTVLLVVNRLLTRPGAS